MLIVVWEALDLPPISIYTPFNVVLSLAVRNASSLKMRLGPSILSLVSLMRWTQATMIGKVAYIPLVEARHRY